MPYRHHPIIIDVEASGFGPHSYPIEVGLAFEDGSRFCTLIRPANDWTHWDESAQGVHNITREMLLEHGRAAQEVAASLNNLLAGKTVYSDGWVVDKPWLIRLFHAAGMSMSFQVSPLELILSEQQMIMWADTKAHLTRQAELVRHRASNDAWLIQQTYQATQSIA